MIVSIFLLHGDALNAVCVQLVGGQFEMESNFVINDPDTILQMLTLMDSCSMTLQASNFNI